MMYLSDELVLEHNSRYSDLYEAAERRRQIREARLAMSDQISDQANPPSAARGVGKLLNLAKTYLRQQPPKLGKLSHKRVSKPSRKQPTRRVLG
ncbi:MAG: hypothetical protein AAF267_07745 [Deinococcota bacterium]